MSEEQAQYLMNFLQTHYCYGNPYVQGALIQLATQMQHRMLEAFHTGERVREQEDELIQLRIQNKGLQDAVDRLEKDNQCIPDLQNLIKETQTNFESFIEQSRELESDALRADELRTANTALETNLTRTKQRTLLLEAELKTVRAKLQSGLDLFKEKHALPSFPVIQNNGHVVDFYRIVSKWAKTAEEDDNTASRSYMCSIENAYTSLAQQRIIDQIQRISTGLGLKPDPPLLFECKTNDSTWTPLSNKHHIQLAATVCYLYANHRATQTASATVNKEVFTFSIDTVRGF